MRVRHRRARHDASYENNKWSYSGDCVPYSASPASFGTSVTLGFETGLRDTTRGLRVAISVTGASQLFLDILLVSQVVSELLSRHGTPVSDEVSARVLMLERER